jgi:hypothetical protein
MANLVQLPNKCHGMLKLCIRVKAEISMLRCKADVGTADFGAGYDAGCGARCASRWTTGCMNTGARNKAT